MLNFNFLKLNSKYPCKNLPFTGEFPIVNIKDPYYFELLNGLKVLVIENNKFPIVNISLEFDRSPILEGDKVGLQSILCNMLRSGTENFTKEEFDDNIDHIGTNLDIYSSNLYLSTLSKYLEKSIYFMSEVLLKPTFDNIKEFEKLIFQSINSIKISSKDPNFIMNRVRRILYYGVNHPYGEYETEETLKNIKIEDLKKFYHLYFKPNIAYLVLVGDITVDNAKKLVYKYFSSWTRGDIPIVNYTSQSKYKNINNDLQIFLVDLPTINQSNIVIGKSLSFKKKNTDYFSGFLANEILGVGIQGRLSQTFREKKGYTYGAYSKLNPDNYISSFYASVQVRTEVTVFSVIEFIKEIKKISNHFVSDKELNIKKNETCGKFLLNLENQKIIGDFIISEMVDGLPKGFYNNYINNIKKVSIIDIIKASKKYFSLENSIIIIVGNTKDFLFELKKLPYSINIINKYGDIIT